MERAALANEPAQLVAFPMRAHRTSSKTLQTGAGQRIEPKLEIMPGLFSEDALLRLLNECIVPALVDRFIGSRLNLPETVGIEHNEASL